MLNFAKASRSAVNIDAFASGPIQGAVAGDGVVPLESAHLEGAEQLTLKCYHSINPSQDTSRDSVRGSWYGSDSVQPHRGD